MVVFAVSSFGSSHVWCRADIWLHADPAEYYVSVEEVEDEYDARANAGRYRAGTSGNPFDVFDSDEEMSEPPRSRAPSPDDVFGAGFAPASSRKRVRTPSPPRRTARNHPTPQKRRLDPRGVLLGTWKHSGLPAVQSNAVFGSRDALNRINRRISKETPSGAVVQGGNMDARKTACSHDDVDYVPRYQGMSDQEVKSHIMPLLAGGYDLDPDTMQPPSPTRASGSRRPRGNPVTASGPPPRFQVRGGRFFVDVDGQVYEQF